MSDCCEGQSQSGKAKVFGSMLTLVSCFLLVPHDVGTVIDGQDAESFPETGSQEVACTTQEGKAKGHVFGDVTHSVHTVQFHSPTGCGVAAADRSFLSSYFHYNNRYY